MWGPDLISKILVKSYWNWQSVCLPIYILQGCPTGPATVGKKLCNGHDQVHSSLPQLPGKVWKSIILAVWVTLIPILSLHSSRHPKGREHSIFPLLWLGGHIGNTRMQPCWLNAQATHTVRFDVFAEETTGDHSLFKITLKHSLASGFVGCLWCKPFSEDPWVILLLILTSRGETWLCNTFAPKVPFFQPRSPTYEVYKWTTHGYLQYLCEGVHKWGYPKMAGL